MDSFVKVTYNNRFFLNTTFDWQSSPGSTPATTFPSFCAFCALSLINVPWNFMNNHGHRGRTRPTVYKVFEFIS